MDPATAADARVRYISLTGDAESDIIPILAGTGMSRRGPRRGAFDSGAGRFQKTEEETRGWSAGACPRAALCADPWADQDG
jgi:hypothetical protein